MRNGDELMPEQARELAELRRKVIELGRPIRGTSYITGEKSLGKELFGLTKHFHIRSRGG